MRKLFLSLLSLLGLIGTAQAQTAIQAVPQHLDAATTVAAGTAAVNTAVTVTFPAVSGQFLYVSSIRLHLCQNTTGGTTLQAVFSTTNLNGWVSQVGSPNVAGQCDQFTWLYPNGLKSAAAGTATVLTIAAPGAQTAAAVTAVGYYGF